MKKLKYNYYKLALVLIDAAIINICTLTALFIRFDGSIPFPYLISYLILALPVTFINLAIY